MVSASTSGSVPSSFPAFTGIISRSSMREMTSSIFPSKRFLRWKNISARKGKRRSSMTWGAARGRRRGRRPKSPSRNWQKSCLPSMRSVRSRRGSLLPRIRLSSVNSKTHSPMWKRQISSSRSMPSKKPWKNRCRWICSYAEMWALEKRKSRCELSSNASCPAIRHSSFARRRSSRSSIIRISRNGWKASASVWQY
ncbi:unknown [Dialister sp. CAG:486]|nr:unknown [Dialister sp. CAG:486]